MHCKQLTLKKHISMAGQNTRNYKKVRSSKGGVSYKRVKKPAKKAQSAKGGLFKRILRRLGRILLSKPFLGLVGSLVITGIIVIAVGLIYYAKMLPDISGLAASKEQPGIEVLASDGSLISRFGQISGNYIPYRKIPKHLIDAVLATEDRRFFDHYGVDPWGVLRAMVANARAGRFVQGGSTITQQLAKNIFLSTERTLTRKIQELMMSFWLEQKFTKKEILSIYLNRVYLGGGSYGVDSAARFYFDKPVEDINLVESAMLAGLLKAPSRYNPTANTKLARGRTEQVIRNMHHAELISEEETKAAIAGLYGTSDDEIGDAADAGAGAPQKAMSFKTKIYDNKQYFADWVKEQLPNYIGELQEDVVVQTTLDTQWQAHAEQAVNTYLTEKVRTSRKAGNVALVAMRPNGEVVSMLGGRDYNHSQYNRATQAMRQPGSSFKLFVYLAALQAGYDPDMTFMDEPIKVGKWKPKNYTKRYRGLVTMRQAIAHSINTVAVSLSQLAGISKVQQLAKKMGIHSPMTNLPSLALGSLEVTLQEMVTAYAHLANNGRMVKPYGVKEIRRKRDGKVLYSRSDKDDYSDVIVIKKEDVAKMNVLLNGVMRNGTGKGARIGRSSAGKTGTTSNYKDAWFVGYTPHLVTGVWIGNDDATPTNKVTGGGLPARIWRSYMKASLKNVAARDLPTAYVSKVRTDMLPWLREGAFSPSSKQNPSHVQKKRKGREVKMDETFWNTLFEEDDASNSGGANRQNDTQYEYPSDRRYRR